MSCLHKSIPMVRLMAPRGSCWSWAERDRSWFYRWRPCTLRPWRLRETWRHSTTDTSMSCTLLGRRVCRYGPYLHCHCLNQPCLSYPFFASVTPFTTIPSSVPYQVFRVFRQVSEEQRRVSEGRYRTLLLEAIQDAVYLSSQNQQLQADNKQLRKGELHTWITLV